MEFQSTPADVSVKIFVASSNGNASDGPRLASERRITPSWTVLQTKSKLETMTGIPPSNQRLLMKAPGRENQWIEGDDRIIGDWQLMRGCEFEIHDTRPAAARPNFSDLSEVEKYTLPTSTYESLSDTVLSWKKSQKLGRFDPSARTPEEILSEQVEKDRTEIQRRGIELSKRAIILPSSPPHVRRGTIRFIGPVPTIPSAGPKPTSPDGPAPLWIGIELDEPTGKNDGSIGGQRYFTCPQNTGVFVKPEKVEVGDFPPLGLDDLEDEDMEEI
ncbi:hypothetical protein AJ80_09627 [Polytolypa hystricis UAMH7299]|uniref:CAP-Gly domain-containing protein n=1 Tax=Polytolypa hystricis (strain UAMH7299) TaxID=1447883 RepID=A0A2B7WMX9_POLH7|nr:hypothetical protein AJ80_09627 [Polytolypa hystricis UAMH7299]